VNRSLSSASLVAANILAFALFTTSRGLAADATAGSAPAGASGTTTASSSAGTEAAASAATTPAPDSGASSSTTTGSESVSAGAKGEVAPSPAVNEPDVPSLEHPRETAPGAFRCSATPLDVGDHPEYKDRNCYEYRLESKSIFIYGGLELDTGYAKYTFKDQPQGPSADFFDMRGRFVVGPMLHHEFGSSGFWVRATGQLVGWVRDQARNGYQINVDDVYGQVGGPLGGGHWDFQVGRFMTWRVYHKGLGYDLYTLEDNGAVMSGSPASGAVYGPHTYEVNYIYYRQWGLGPYGDDEEIAGRAALHYFPLRSLGFELTGVWGQGGGGSSNSLGGRFAADYHAKLGPVFVRLSGAAEDRHNTLAKPQINQVGTDENGAPIYKECPDCSLRDYKGAGGGAILKFSIVEIGGGLARGWDIAHKGANTTEGAPRDPAKTGVRTSYGGYLQLDPGSLLFKRALIIGAGLNHTENVADTDDYQEHLQGAAYLAFPLGFNDAMIKLVLSRAELSSFTRTSAPGAKPIHYNQYDSAMTSARVRFAYYF
jgi:hypothetical protein